MDCFVQESGGPTRTRPMETNDPNLLGYINPQYASKIPKSMLSETFKEWTLESRVQASHVYVFNNENRNGYELKMSRLVTKPTKWLVRPAKTQRSAWASAQSYQSLIRSLSAWRKLGSLATHWAQAKTLIRLGECPGWSVFTGRIATLLVLSCCGSNQECKAVKQMNVKEAMHIAYGAFSVYVPWRALLCELNPI